MKSIAKNLLLFVIVADIFTLFFYLIIHMPQKHQINENTNRMYNLTDFQYLISKPKCRTDESAPYFVTLVHSSPTQFTRRAACRDTWAHSDPRTITYFLMGSVASQSLQHKINNENDQYQDIIQGNFHDSYHNLTYKHTMALKWFTENCPHVKYLLKLDDDVFVNVPATYEYLLNNRIEENFILGIYFPPFVTCRDGKWKTSFDDIREKFIPEYASGQSIIYSNDFVRKAYKKTFTTRFLWIDDLLISGYIRMQLNVRIEPIYPFRLSDVALKMILNGLNTTLPDPMFMVSEHDMKYDDVIKLWNFTASYRLQHQP